MFVYNPVNFDPCEALPPSLRRYADDARYLLHKIFEHRIFDHRTEDAFIPLKARYLISVMSERRFVNIRDALVEGGVIEIDNHYIQGQKSIGYRLTHKFRSARHHKVKMRNQRLVRRMSLRKAEQLGEITLDVHQHLYRFLLDIEINYESAITDIEEDFVVNEVSVAMIRDGCWFFHSDDYGRVHTNISNLKSSLRKHLVHKGRNLRNIDIRNSQPLFLAILLLNFYSNNGSLSFYTPPSPSPLPLRSDISVPSDVMKYVMLSQNGTLYDVIASMIGDERDRGVVKKRLFRELFFCRNKPWRTDCEKVFEREFPNVYGVIRDLKRDDYTHLSKLLQKTESGFIINGVVRDCMNQHPDMFVTTIHDSVMVAEEDVPVVRELLLRRFSHYGITPELKVE